MFLDIFNWFYSTSGHSSGGFFMSFLKIIINNCILYYKKYYICSLDGKAPVAGKAVRGEYLNQLKTRL